MTGVRDFTPRSKSRSEILPLKLDLDNTSERTCTFFAPFPLSYFGVVPLTESLGRHY